MLQGRFTPFDGNITVGWPQALTVWQYSGSRARPRRSPPEDRDKEIVA